MADLLAAFPDGEDVIMAVLDPALAPAVQSTPANFTPPLIQVLQTGGTSTRIDDRPVITVHYFGTDYPTAKAMAREGEQLILAARGTRVQNVPGHPGGVLVDRVESVTSPREISYQDPVRRRKTASYRLVMRRPRSL